MDKQSPVLKILSIIVMIAILITIDGFLHKDNRTNVLIDNRWQFFPGATLVENGIHIAPLSRMIIHQDGSQGQPNPPVYLDQHYLIEGDFDITFNLLQIDQGASVRLYASPPIVYDQWRRETPSIDLALDKVENTLVARIWDGNSNTSMDIRKYQLAISSDITISLQHIKDQINILADGKLLGNMPDHDIFKQKTIWLGFGGASGSKGWILSGLSVQPINQGNVKIMVAPQMIADQSDSSSLQNLAEAHPKKITIGTAVNVDVLFSDPQYRNLALTQFNIFTPENNLKPQFVQPSPGIYDFAQADQLVNLALKNNIAVHGHTLVYSKSSPEWMTKSPKESLQKIMTDHITNVVSHFKGKLASWDVVNEPFSQKHSLYGFGKSGLDENIWFEAMGEKYIDLAFKTAREADPEAKLYLNDYGLENDGAHWDALLSLIKRLKQRGVPIDGVGFESHIYGDGDYLKKDQFKKHMEELNRLGLLVRVSEIDVTGDEPVEQINQYVLALDMCLKAPNCTSYSTWGITDKYGSTTRSDRYPAVYGTSLLWDKDMKLKPAYSALQQRLGQNN